MNGSVPAADRIKIGMLEPECGTALHGSGRVEMRPGIGKDRCYLVLTYYTPVFYILNGVENGIHNERQSETLEPRPADLAEKSAFR